MADALRGERRGLDLRGERRGLDLGRRWLAAARARLVDPAGVLALLDRLGVACARAASPAAPRQQVAAGATGDPPAAAPARRDAAGRARPPGE
ncbi:hypothetical protein [Sorangium sp. So ce1151]|uniref:hypothetical protein n=1 Tax=Sorangium sp. So ce1151 TaxID=3133332 RepID=UPI003F5D6732